MKKRILSMLLAAFMVMALIPTTVLADDINLTATCTNYTVTFTVGGATVKSATATPSGNNGTLELTVSDVTGNVTVTPAFSNTTASIIGTDPANISLDVSSGSAQTSFRVMAMAGGPRPLGSWTVNITVDQGSSGGGDGSGDGQEPGGDEGGGEGDSTPVHDTSVSGGSSMGAHTIAFTVDKGSITDTQYVCDYDAMWATGTGNATITLSGVSAGEDVTVSAVLSGTITGGMGQGRLDKSSAAIKVGETGTFLIKNTSGPANGTTHITVNVTLAAADGGGQEPGDTPEPPAATIEITSDLNEDEVTYTVGDTAEALSVAAEHSQNGDITYQWYKNTTNSTDNGTAISGAAGASYTPSTDSEGTAYYYVVASCGSLSVTSKAAKITVKPAPINHNTVLNNFIDLTDYTNGKLTVKGITVSGTNVISAVEQGFDLTIVIDSSTADDASVTCTYSASSSHSFYSVQNAAHTIQLSEGTGEKAATVTAKWSRVDGSATYNIKLVKYVPTVAPTVKSDAADRDNGFVGTEYLLDLADIFSNASKLYYKLGEEDFIPLNGGILSVTPAEKGTLEYTFKAENTLGSVTHQFTLSVIDEADSYIQLSNSYTNGSVNYVRFVDSAGNPVFIDATVDGTVITAPVPRSFGANSVIKAIFDITQNGESGGYALPFLTSSTATSGTTSSQWKGQIKNQYSCTLSGGTGRATAYLFDHVPGSNTPEATYTINYVIANTAPELTGENQGSGSISADNAYTFKLAELFSDSDGDTLVYKVSVNGGSQTVASVDGDGYYSFNTDASGTYTLVFNAYDAYGGISQAYTLTVTVSNSLETYDINVTMPENLSPVFYYTEDAQQGTELEAAASGNVYTVKVPKNVKRISWRANSMGMSAEVSVQNNAITVIKSTYTVTAGENTDTQAVVTVKYGDKQAVGKDNAFLLLSTGIYTVTAKPGSQYSSAWNAVTLSNQAAVSGNTNIELESRAIPITVPYFATVTVGAASTRQGVKPTAITPYKTEGPNYASGTTTYYFILNNNTVYEYRVSVPDDNITRDQYVTYVGVFTKTDTTAITVTKEQLEAGDNGRTTIDHELEPYSNGVLESANIADLYMNVNAQGYLKLDIDSTRQLYAARSWWATSGGGWALHTYYFAEPDYTYTVVDTNGQPSSDVITVDKNGMITAVGTGTAIVLVSYDAMNVDFEDALYLGCEKPNPDGFYGAIWPENTGVFVVSVGAEDSGIDTGMTINTDKILTSKTAKEAIDAELDVIYFIGDSGKYTFTPATEGVTVSVANPVISGNTLSFSGFTNVSANADGSVTVPLTNGRNIVKIEKDGKFEYQVITAKSVTVTVNGKPLDEAIVAPGEEVSIVFDTLYNPVNRMALYNSAAATVYSDISGYPYKTAGGYRGGMGYYFFASSDFCQTVANFNNAGTDGSGHGNNSVSLGDKLTVPEDFDEDYFVLSDGAFSVGGFSKFKLGDHRTAMGQAPSTGGADNIIAFFGTLPDISIPVAQLESLEVTTSPTKTEYAIGDVFDPSGMVVTAHYDNDTDAEFTSYSYDTSAFTQAGEKQIAITGGGKTVYVTVTVTSVELTSIEITTSPSKTMYYIGDEFEPGGMVVTAHYSDLSHRVVTLYDYSPKTLDATSTHVTISYGSKTVDQSITMSLVEEIIISTPPTKTQYTEGESFSPAGMVVKIRYTNNFKTETDEFKVTPSGALTAGTAYVTITYTGDEASPSLQSAQQAITVTASGNNDGGDGGDGDSENGENTPQINYITVYMSFTDYGEIIVYNTPVKIYDDGDGSYSIGDAFKALHRDHYSYGESGYEEISNSVVTGWVSKFWGEGSGTFSYAHNNGWASSTAQSIADGDKISAFNGVDEVAYSDLYTWFDYESDTAVTEQETTFTVNGMNIMGSGPNGDQAAPPAGAAVTVYDSSGSEITELATVVDENGNFSIVFPETGYYTIEISGTARYDDYTDAPVVPCRCEVRVTAPGQNNNTQQEVIRDYAFTGKFSDLDKALSENANIWWASAVDHVVRTGLMNGVDTNTFAPDATLTRAMAVTIIHRMAGSPETSCTSAFTDLSADWYKEAVCWAEEAGITKGRSDTVFDPNAYVTREELAVLIYRYAEYRGINMSAYSSLSNYTDVSSISSWALQAIRWTNAMSLINGRTNTTIDPASTATRAEAAAIIMRFANIFGN